MHTNSSDGDLVRLRALPPGPDPDPSKFKLSSAATLKHGPTAEEQTAGIRCQEAMLFWQKQGQRAVFEVAIDLQEPLPAGAKLKALISWISIDGGWGLYPLPIEGTGARAALVAETHVSVTVAAFAATGGPPAAPVAVRATLTINPNTDEARAAVSCEEGRTGLDLSSLRP